MIEQPQQTHLNDLLRRKYPTALPPRLIGPPEVLSSGMAAFDALFPNGGLPYGQLIELTGGPSSGKTSLLLRLLSSLSRRGPVAYIDAGGTFYPGAAVGAGVVVEQLVAVRSLNPADAVRAAESIVHDRLARVVVCDLIYSQGTISTARFHRLRIQAVRSRAMVLFLTDGANRIIPPSMMSVQVTVERIDEGTVAATVTKSRLSPEGARAEVSVDGH